MEILKQVQKPDMQVIGITTRTTNADEMKEHAAKIPALWGRFMQGQVSAAIPHKINAFPILAVYYDYESNEHGAYSQLIGHEVTSLAEIPEGMVGIALPASTYAVFTTERGPVTEIIGKAWQTLWSMSPEQLGGQRSYTGDFELYDERSLDPQNAQIDIYIALK